MPMEEIMDGLEPILDVLDAIPREAFAKYRDEYPSHVRIDHDARAAATCIYSHMESGAHALEAVDGVHAMDVRGLKVWLYRDQAVIRFKRMDEEGRFRRYPTKQAKDYDAQRPIPGLPPPAERLVVGYLPDPTGTSIVRVQIAKPMGREIDWCAAIVPSLERTAGERPWIDVTRVRRFA